MIIQIFFVLIFDIAIFYREKLVFELLMPIDQAQSLSARSMIVNAPLRGQLMKHMKVSTMYRPSSLFYYILHRV